jgi:hypothetical protein
MPDYQLIAENGVALEEDVGAEEAILREGARTVRDLTATDTLMDSDYFKLITNSGAAGAASSRPLTLPAPAVGKCIRFADVSLGLRLIAPATKTIIVGNKVTKAAGYIETVTPCIFELWCLDANTFMVKGDASLFDVEIS